MAQTFASQRLHGIAARLRADGQRGLRLEMTRAMRTGAQPLVLAVRQAALQKLPKSGGLAAAQAEQAIRISVLTGSRTAGVRIRTFRRGSFQTDKGYVRHPTPSLMGYDRSYWDWVRQEIPEAAGWWTDTLKMGSPAVTRLILLELERVARRIQGGY